MAKVSISMLPEAALLQNYKQMPDSYTDCYAAHIGRKVSIEDYVRTFYTGRLFRMERWIIARIVHLGSSDAQLSELLDGNSDKFSAWTIEDRNERQLLMCDYQKRTRSWFMAEPCRGGTRIYFGTAVVKTSYLKRGEGAAPLIFRLLMPVHRLYARLLIGSAARRLRKLS